MKEISSLHDITEDSYFIFKHSIYCPTSSRARTVAASAESSTGLPVYVVNIQGNRALSNEIERHFGIRHESPQMILVRDGKALWHASHFRITADAIENAANEITAAQG